MKFNSNEILEPFLSVPELIGEKKNDRFIMSRFNGTFVEDWFKKMNPNSKIAVIVDRESPGGKNEPMIVFESGAIFIYLADRTEKFLAPIGSRQRYETLEWLM